MDLLIYGATGFAGKCVAHKLASQIASETVPGLSWGIGGRSSTRLAALSDEISTSYPSIPKPKTVVVDVESVSREQLASTLGCSRVVVNCAGPFKRLGPQVVRACIDSGIDYIDISGELSFIFHQMLEEGARAREKGSLVVSACGFDSIPAEIGCLYTSNTLRDTAAKHGADKTENQPQTTHVESFMKLRSASNRPGAHVTTLECILDGFKTSKRAEELASMLRSEQGAAVCLKEPPNRPQAPQEKGGLFKDDRGKLDEETPYVTAFPGPDKMIVQQTLTSISKGYAKVPQSSRWHSYACYVSIGDSLAVFKLFVFSVLVLFVSILPGGTRLIMQFPSFFTGGIFSREGPSEKARKSSAAQFDFYGKRYHGAKQVGDAVTRLTIRDPGYTGTGKMALACAMTLPQDRDNTPKGGILTPGAAFGGTALIKRLADSHAISFETLHAE